MNDKVAILKLEALILEKVKTDPIAQLYDSISTESIDISDEEFKDYVIDELQQSGNYLTLTEFEEENPYQDMSDMPTDKTILLIWEELSKLRQEVSSNINAFNDNIVEVEGMPSQSNILLVNEVDNLS